MAKIKYSDFITGNGQVTFEGIMSNNYVERIFDPTIYSYLRFFDVGGRFDLYINDNPNKVEINGNGGDFVLKDIPIYKFKLVSVSDGSLITQEMITANPTKYQQSDLNKYYYSGSTSIQYILCR